MLNPKKTIKKILPKKAIKEWQENIQYQRITVKIYYLATYTPVTPALIAIALNIPMVQVKNAIAMLEAQGCLLLIKHRYKAILAIPLREKDSNKVSAERGSSVFSRRSTADLSTIEVIAQQKWEQRPVSIPMKTKIRDLPEIRQVLLELKR